MTGVHSATIFAIIMFIAEIVRVVCFSKFINVLWINHWIIYSTNLF